MGMDWWKATRAPCYTKNLVVAARRNVLAGILFLHPQVGRGNAGLLGAHGTAAVRVSWANQDLLPVSSSGMIQYILWKSRSVFAETVACLLQRKPAYGFYPPLFIYKGDPDHQLSSTMGRKKKKNTTQTTSLRLIGQQALDKKE